MIIRPRKEKAYKFEQITIRLRWTDLQRIKAMYPPVNIHESASAYFQRLALWLTLHPWSGKK